MRARHTNSLPAEVQSVARRNLNLLNRALGVPVPEGVQWFWIGTHAEYDRLIG